MLNQEQTAKADSDSNRGGCWMTQTSERRHPGSAPALELLVQAFAQLVNASGQALSNKWLRDLIECSDLLRTQPVEIAMQHGGPVRLVEAPYRGDEPLTPFASGPNVPVVP